MKMNDRLALARAYLFKDEDSGATSFKSYFKILLKSLWRQGEGFSGKRPFGNSDWQWNIYKYLVESGAVEGGFDDDGYLDWFKQETADRVIIKLIESFGEQE